MIRHMPSKIHIVNAFCTLAVVGALVWSYVKDSPNRSNASVVKTSQAR